MAQNDNDQQAQVQAVPQPKYRMGQTLHTVRLSDLTHITFVVGGIDIKIRKDEVRISYYTESGYCDYDEPKCFETEEELMKHITQK